MLVLSQVNRGQQKTLCYDSLSVMSGRDGGMQKLIQNKLNREILYIHCFDYQLHLVIVHAISSESVTGIHDYMEGLRALDSGSGNLWMLGKFNHYCT